MKVKRSWEDFQPGESDFFGSPVLVQVRVYTIDAQPTPEIAIRFLCPSKKVRQLVVDDLDGWCEDLCQKYGNDSGYEVWMEEDSNGELVARRWVEGFSLTDDEES
jgi:hypothetical protein